MSACAKRRECQRRTRLPTRRDDKPEDFLDRHLNDVYGYVAFRLAPDLGAVEDLVQEVVLAALRGWHRYRGDAPRLQWMRSIARHKIADYLRKRPGPSLDMDTIAGGSSGDSPVEEQAKVLSAVMRSLPADYAELLEEKYLECLSVREIAQMHAKSEKSIESALSRARAMLREKCLRLQRKLLHVDHTLFGVQSRLVVQRHLLLDDLLLSDPDSQIGDDRVALQAGDPF